MGMGGGSGGGGDQGKPDVQLVRWILGVQSPLPSLVHAPFKVLCYLPLCLSKHSAHVAISVLEVREMSPAVCSTTGQSRVLRPLHALVCPELYSAD